MKICRLPTHAIAALLLSPLLLCTPPPAMAQVAAESETAESEAAVSDAAQWTQRLTAITRRSDSSSRADAISQLLKPLELTCEVVQFEAKELVGRNLSLQMDSHGDRLIVLGAHYDQVALGNGVIDNGSSCAALIELCERFKARPLSQTDLKFIFFDLEEQGLLGSKAHVAALQASEQRRPEVFINLDIFGYGDAAWLMSESPDDRWTSLIREAFEAAKFPVTISPRSKYPPSDHVPFVEADIPTVAFALIGQSEIAQVQSLLAGQRGEIPPILNTIHTSSDTLAKLNVTQCLPALEALENAIRQMDNR